MWSLLEVNGDLSIRSQETLKATAESYCENCRTVKVTDIEPYYIRAVPATKAGILC